DEQSYITPEPFSNRRTSVPFDSADRGVIGPIFHFDVIFRRIVGNYSCLALYHLAVWQPEFIRGSNVCDDPLGSHATPDQGQFVEWIAKQIEPEPETAGQKEQSQKDSFQSVAFYNVSANSLEGSHSEISP